jgi:uncharacterized membrane protein
VESLTDPDATGEDIAVGFATSGFYCGMLWSWRYALYTKICGARFMWNWWNTSQAVEAIAMIDLILAVYKKTDWSMDHLSVDQWSMDHFTKVG